MSKAVVIRTVVMVVAGGLWLYFGKPVDEMQLHDFVETVVGLLMGKELLKRTGD